MMRALFALFALFCCVTTCSAINANAAERILANDARVAQMGRVEETTDAAVRFSYPGVSFRVELEGSSLSIEASGTGKETFLEVSVDGAPAQALHLSNTLQSFPLMTQASSGRHSVEVMQRSETWQGISSIQSWQTDGKFLAAPVLPSRRILLLGDSVSCGAAIGREPGQANVSFWGIPRLSYGMLAAQTLQAQVQLVCYGGRGLLRSWNGNTDDLNLPDFFALTIPDAAHPVQWDARRYPADVILVAIGTNDFTVGTPEREKYVATYVRLLQRLLVDYPQAQIGITEGAILNGKNKEAMIGFLAESAQRLQNPRVHQLVSQYHPGDARDAHPTEAQHRLMANDLIAQLRKMMDW